MPANIQNIIVLGSGNLAVHLVRAFVLAGKNIRQVYSRSGKLPGLNDVAGNIEIIHDLQDMSKDADLYVLSVPDRALPEIISRITLPDHLIVHTSGSVSIDVFEDRFRYYGVFYPVQTFSKKKALAYKNIPVCIESNDPAGIQALTKLAEDVFGRACEMDSPARLKIHMAAVFASNFTNHLYDIAHDLLDSSDIPFDIIRPLIMEAAAKVQADHPASVQTGPAQRGDHSIIEKHLKELAGSPDLRDIYKMITDSIISFKRSRS